MGRKLPSENVHGESKESCAVSSLPHTDALAFVVVVVVVVVVFVCCFCFPDHKAGQIDGKAWITTQCSAAFSFLIVHLFKKHNCTVTETVRGLSRCKRHGHVELFVCWLVGCLTPQQQASVSQGRICSDNLTCCHTEIEVADQTFYLTQSQYSDTGPTSPSADPITPGA